MSSYSNFLSSFYAPILRDTADPIDPNVFKIVPHFYSAYTKDSLTLRDDYSAETDHIWRSWGVVCIRGNDPSGTPNVSQIRERTKTLALELRPNYYDNRSNIMAVQIPPNSSTGIQVIKQFYAVFGLLAFLPEFIYYDHCNLSNTIPVVSGTTNPVPGNEIVYIRFPRPYGGPFNGVYYEIGRNVLQTFMDSSGNYGDVYDTDLFSNVKPRSFSDPLVENATNNIPASSIQSLSTKVEMSPVVCREVIESWYDLGKSIQPMDFVNAYPNLASYLEDPYLAFQIRDKMNKNH